MSKVTKSSVSESPEQGPLVIAHRGFSWVAPENTLLAMQRAIDVGVRIIECDLHLSADGVPVVMHDASLARTTGHNAPIASLTLAELQRLDAGLWKGPEFAGQRIPTLAQVLALAAGRVQLFLELKVGHMVPELLAVIDQCGFPVSDLMVFSFHLRAVREARQRCPAVSTLFLIHKLPQDPAWQKRVLEAAQDAGCTAVGVDFEQTDAAFLSLSHASELGVYAYTVNEEDDMDKMASIGVNGLITDRPDVALKRYR